MSKKTLKIIIIIEQPLTTIVYKIQCAKGELLFIMALLGQTLQTHQKNQEGDTETDINLDFDDHLTLQGGGRAEKLFGCST